MKVNITRVENNIDYMDIKDPAIFNETDDGLIIVQNNVYAFCDRIWLTEDLSLEAGWRYRYEITSDTAGSFEGWIIDKGVDEHGPYIVFLMKQAFYHELKKTTRPKPSIGENQIEVSLSPEMIAGAEQLLENCNGKWPSFHDAKMVILERKPDRIALQFSDGYLMDKIVQIILKDITHEAYDDSLEYFANEWITGIDFRKKGNHFEFILLNEYTTETFPEGFDISCLEDPNFDSSILDEILIQKEFRIHGTITCRNIEIQVTTDEAKKFELEEQFKKFKDGSLIKEIYEQL